MKIKITKGDFDKAVSVPWNPNSCLLQQAAYRQELQLSGTDIGYKSDTAGELMETFDGCHRMSFCHPDSQLGLSILREALPITIEL